MDIVIINQPIGNRGDEAAHNALVRSLLSVYPDSIIRIAMYPSFGKENCFRIDDSRVSYFDTPYHRGLTKFIKYSYLMKSIGLLKAFHPFVHMYRKFMKGADVIINAPGGICLGGFQNWYHVLWLDLALELNVKLYYFSRSIGPFSSINYRDRIFKNKATFILKHNRLIFLRDQKSIEYAKEINLVNYVTSVDAAFLEVPLKQFVAQNMYPLNGIHNYVVFVPNELVWHISYRNINREDLINMYQSVIDIIRSKYPGVKILMLPQLFGNSNGFGDYLFFTEIKRCSNFSEDIIVLDEYVSSDIQQVIISGAQLVIGGRYHSVVFAINNKVPFISLTYEHKMSGLLSFLELEKLSVDLVGIADNIDGYKDAIYRISNIIDKHIIPVDRQTQLAHSIANKMFSILISDING